MKNTKMLSKAWVVIFVFAFPAGLVHGEEYIFWNSETLESLKESDSGVWPKLRDYIKSEAENCIESGNTYSVTDNDKLPPSGDRQDYYSTGPYWWPNPDTEDGLPYVHRDGEFNPERDIVSDREPMHNMIRDAGTMALAYHVFKKERYRAHGEKLIRVWFLDPETGMNPNLNHAQAIPGRVKGRGTGIIDTLKFTELVDPLRLLNRSGAFSQKEWKSIQDWFEQFTDWLAYHPYGFDERMSDNNHGTAYDLQLGALGLFLGKEQIVHDLVEVSVTNRLDQQITSDGRQPEELARTRTWSYCTENLRHYLLLNRLGEKVGYSLWEYESDEGASLKKAFKYLKPYICDNDSWPHPQITEWQNEYIFHVLNLMPGKDFEEIDDAYDCLVPRLKQNNKRALLWGMLYRAGK